MNQQLVTMAVGLGLSQVARRLDLDTPERLWGIRALYLATNVIIFALYLYIAAKVRRAEHCLFAAVLPGVGADLASSMQPQVRRRNDNTILKYVEPKPFSVC